MRDIDYTRGRLFTKKRRKRITDVRVLADREERNVVTPVINPSGTISFSFDFDGNDSVSVKVKVKKNKTVLRKRVKTPSTNLRLTQKFPRINAQYFEQAYGTKCIRCGRRVSDLRALGGQIEELCRECKKMFPSKPTVSRLMFIDNTGGVSKIINVIDKNKSLVFKRKKREEVKKWYGSLKAIAQEEHNSYTEWVRRNGYTDSINIVRRT